MDGRLKDLESAVKELKKSVATMIKAYKKAAKKL